MSNAREKYILALANLINGSELGYEDRISIPQYKKDIEDYVDSLEKELINKKERNLVDLGFYENEPVGFKYDKSIEKPVLACRCDNYYYAYPTKTGWVWYRSRFLGDERNKEIGDISFIDWSYMVLKEVE